MYRVASGRCPAELQPIFAYCSGLGTRLDQRSMLVVTSGLNPAASISAAISSALRRTTLHNTTVAHFDQAANDNGAVADSFDVVQRRTNRSVPFSASSNLLQI